MENLFRLIETFVKIFAVGAMLVAIVFCISDLLPSNYGDTYFLFNSEEEDKDKE